MYNGTLLGSDEVKHYTTLGYFDLSSRALATSSTGLLVTSKRATGACYVAPTCASISLFLKLPITSTFQGFIHCNPNIRKNEYIVPNQIDVAEVGRKRSYCRCWRSAKVRWGRSSRCSGSSKGLGGLRAGLGQVSRSCNYYKLWSRDTSEGNTIMGGRSSITEVVFYKYF